MFLPHVWNSIKFSLSECPLVQKPGRKDQIAEGTGLRSGSDWKGGLVWIFL